MNARPLVSFTTDFGDVDPYAGAMKAVLLSRLSGVDIVDITHQVPPQDVVTGAFLFETTLPSFPFGTVHVVVVDPGVGSNRARLAIAANGSFFVGPDNGCLSAAISPEGRGHRGAGEGYDERSVSVPTGMTAVRIENLAVLGITRPSATFEGRDIFTPAAAWLAAGRPIEELGPAVDSLLAFPEFRAPIDSSGEIYGRVLHVDHFGNLITDIIAGDVFSEPVFTVAGARVMGMAATYAEARGATAIIGSSGRVEFAVPGGNAALTLGAARGDRVRVSRAA